MDASHVGCNGYCCCCRTSHTAVTTTLGTNMELPRRGLQTCDCHGVNGQKCEGFPSPCRHGYVGDMLVPLYPLTSDTTVSPTTYLLSSATEATLQSQNNQATSGHHDEDAPPFTSSFGKIPFIIFDTGCRLSRPAPPPFPSASCTDSSSAAATNKTEKKPSKKATSGWKPQRSGGAAYIQKVRDTPP